MPLIDVNDVIVDPDLSDVFTVLRRTESVSTDTGLPVITEAPVAGVQRGVITPEEGALSRDDDSQMTARTISVITPFRLRASSEGVQPDIILYDGIRFTVTEVKGWHRFGRGFVTAKATSMNASDTPLV